MPIAFQTNLLALNAAVEAARARTGMAEGSPLLRAEVRHFRSVVLTKQEKSAHSLPIALAASSEGTKLVNQSNREINNIVTGTRKVRDSGE
nr:hypothetical protein [Pectobacterium parmentieri]